ncbi:MFS transporter [Neogemmobacter tilapiae]|uniref:MFS transporter n=1 Tax=Neogemmobacter tilapiae TaxID=875041 RepID=A0A918TJM2_9RHOB|nr:MFS transporter [Gemmobacter tilapiae]GHC50739.1 MFS transporter [Gemmobacter tilapiae]
MQIWFSILRRHAVVRAAALAIFLYGFAGAATSPYQSMLAIQDLGLSDSAYAWIALLASVANVTMAIVAGLLSDRMHSYRAPLIFVSAFGILGYGMIWAIPSPLTFVLATIGPLALFHATNSMLFGAVRAQTDRFEAEEARIVNALMRIMVSLSWVLMPGVVGIMMRGRDSMIAAWAIAAVVAAACMATILFGMKGADDTPPPPSRAALGDLRLLVGRGILARVLGVALISQVLHVNTAVLPLIVTGQAGGKPEDIGFLVGMVAVLEVGFMVYWAWAVRGHNLTRALLISSALYLVYLGGLAVASAPWHVYAASLIAGFSAAALISLPISYLLDLIRDRPGLSASLLAVNYFLGGALGAGVFGIGTALGGYGLTALLSGGLGVLGALLLMGLEHGKDHA